jgi:hypothetical protein
MTPVTVILIGIGAVLALVYARLRIRKNHCMWYWDNISHLYSTQCGGTTSLIDNTNEVKFRYCPICEKPITINNFIDRQEGSL